MQAPRNVVLSNELVFSETEIEFCGSQSFYVQVNPDRLFPGNTGEWAKEVNHGNKMNRR